MTAHINFGDVGFTYGDSWAVTVINGRAVAAAAEPTPAYALLARQIGYGSDVDRMCVDHELVHNLLAHAIGLAASPTLARVAVDRDAPATDLTRLEEIAVLAVQAYALEAGVNLRSMSRPWF